MSGLLYLLPGAAAVLAAMLGGASLFTKLPTRQLVFFGLLNLGTFLWANGYFLGYTLPIWAGGKLSPVVGEALFLVPQLGVALVATYWFAFSAETTGRGEWARGTRLALVHAPGILLVLGAATNPWHHLFVTAASPAFGSVSYGPVGLAILASIYVLVAATVLMYALRSGPGSDLPVAARVPLASGSFAMLVTNIAWTTRGLTGLTLPYNPTIVLLPFVNLLIALLVLRTDLLDVVPAAESHAFHSMADAGIVLTPAGRVVAVNDAACRMVPQIRRGSLLAEVAPALATDVARVAAGYTDAPHGEDAWWLRVVPMSLPSGRHLGMLVLLTDSAEKRAFEQRIVELNRDLRHTVLELESATRAKDRFIANASHELRTPLQSVIGYTQRLLFERVGRLEKAQRDELEIVERSARHLLAVIESLLDIAQLESGEISTTSTRFDASQTVRQVMEAVEPMATAKGLSLDMRTDGLSEIVTDETKLRQILINLVANGVKFTREGGVTVSCRREPACAVFEVSDTGPGIPAEELQHIFEAFHRVRTTGLESIGGSGLGLYVSQVLAGMLGGTLEVDSRAGAGTTFILQVQQEAVWDETS